ncbi:MAG: SRPBCC family protein [Actinomycetota bacterium]|nr:SRPBCC family protein [Actinomycetota bacterium]
MTTGIEIEPVRKTIAVQAPVEKAFAVFTDGIATWWPLQKHSVGADRGGEAPESAVFEGRVGGRVFERSSDGSESDWGEVLVWEPPRRIVYTWHPGHADPSIATEVEVRFRPDGGGTRVEIEHRGWERLGEPGARTRESYDSGWDTVLGRYTEAFSP